MVRAVRYYTEPKYFDSVSFCIFGRLFVSCAIVGDYDAGFDYIGSLLYLKTEEETLLASAAFGSGRIVATDQSTVPHYYLCDHLGSTRANGKWIVDGKVAAHEFGHITGLQDRYVDKEDNGQKQSIPNQGWETNIMGVKRGEVGQRNIDDILKRPFEHYNDIKDSWWKSWFDNSNSYLIQTIDK